MAKLLKDPECPRDRTKLVEKKISVPGIDVTVDECPKCHGIFFDKNEVKRVTGHDKLNELLTKKLGYDSDSQVVCPGCGWVMDMEDADGVETEVCLKCYGVWLDHGELQALKGKDDPTFASFTPAKIAELQRATEIRKRDRARWWKAFTYRISGRDILDAQKQKRQEKKGKT